MTRIRSLKVSTRAREVETYKKKRGELIDAPRTNLRLSSCSLFLKMSYHSPCEKTISTISKHNLKTIKRTLCDDLQAVRLQLYKDGEAGFEANKVLADDGKSGLGDSDWLGERESRERKESKENRVRARVHR